MKPKRKKHPTLLHAALLGGLLLNGALAAQDPSRVLPQSLDAPRAGEQVPDFTLPDVTGGSVKLSEFIRSGRGGEPGWVLLVFFRGTW